METETKTKTGSGVKVAAGVLAVGFLFAAAFAGYYGVKYTQTKKAQTAKTQGAVQGSKVATNVVTDMLLKFGYGAYKNQNGVKLNTLDMSDRIQDQIHIDTGTLLGADVLQGTDLINRLKGDLLNDYWRGAELTGGASFKWPNGQYDETNHIKVGGNDVGNISTKHQENCDTIVTVTINGETKTFTVKGNSSTNGNGSTNGSSGNGNGSGENSNGGLWTPLSLKDEMFTDMRDLFNTTAPDGEYAAFTYTIKDSGNMVKTGEMTHRVATFSWKDGKMVPGSGQIIVPKGVVQ